MKNTTVDILTHPIASNRTALESPRINLLAFLINRVKFLTPGRGRVLQVRDDDGQRRQLLYDSFNPREEVVKTAVMVVKTLQHRIRS
jgi:hypothetical protein